MKKENNILLLKTLEQVKLLIEKIFNKNTFYKNTTVNEIFLLKKTIEHVLFDINIGVVNIFDFKKIILIIDILFKNNLTKISMSESVTLAIAILKISRIIDSDDLRKLSLNMAEIVSINKKQQKMKQKNILEIKEIKKEDNKKIFMSLK